MKKLLSMVAIIMATATLLPCCKPDNGNRETLQERRERLTQSREMQTAVTALRVRDADRAESALQSEIETNPDNAYAYVLLAQVMRLQRRTASAIQMADKAMRHLSATEEPFWVSSALAERALAYDYDGDSIGCAKDLNAAIVLAPDNIAAWQYRAQFYYVHDDTERGDADCDSCIARWPDDEWAYNWKAINLFAHTVAIDSVSASEKAIPLFEASAKACPTQTVAYIWLNILYNIIGDHDAAMRNILTALMYDPENEDAIGILSEYDTQTVERHLQLMRSASVDSECYWQVLERQGRMELAMEDYGMALELLSKSFRLNPVSETMYYMSLCNLRSGNVDAAISCATESFALDTTDLELLLMRANLYACVDSLDAAIHDLDYVIERQPDNEAAYAMRSKAHRLAGHSELALADALAALRIEPRDVEMNGMCGQLYFERGDTLRARLYFQECNMIDDIGEFY